MRLRILFEKTALMRFTGHLDLHRTWERTFRRSGLALAYSQGFHPQPRINLACALPLGFTSQCELVDVWLESDVPLDQVTQALTLAVPPGILIREVTQVDDRLPSLQSQVYSSLYQVTLLDPPPDLAMRIEALLSAASLPRQRRGKPYDLRPLVEAFDFVSQPPLGETMLHLRLSAREAATGRPEEVLSALDVPLESSRIHRLELFLAA